MNALLVTNSDLIAVNRDHSTIDLYADKDTVISNKTKLKWECTLELHLRNSEVIGIPILNSELTDDIVLLSHSILNPLQGTHHNLYITFGLVSQEFVSSDVKFPERTRIVTIKLVSKAYWRLLKSKNVEGILPAPIKIIDKVEIE